MGRYARPCRSTLAVVSLLGSILLAGDRADAATLNLVLDKPFYHPGETITLRLIGDSQGATDLALWAAIEVDRTAMLGLQAQLFAPPTGTAYPWTQGGIAGCGGTSYFNKYPNRCVLINDIYFDALGGQAGVDPALEPFTWAVLTATAGATGTYAIDFANTPTSQRLDFFGLTSAPGTTLLIHNPEPGTGALLALGLCGVAFARRRRACH